MKAIIGTVLFCSATTLAEGVAKRYAPVGSTFTYYRDAGCSSGASSEAYETVLLPASSDDCISGVYDLAPGGWATSPDDDSIYLGYYTGDGIPSSCNVAILKQANIAASDCGTAIEVINGGTTGSCVQGKIPAMGGMAMCCDGVGNGCADVPAVKKRDANVSTPRRRHIQEDFTHIKHDDKKFDNQKKRHSDRLAKRDCTFTAAGNPFVSRGSQQIVTNGVSCPGATGGAACPIVSSASITSGSSNSFGVSDSITAGGDFFVTLEDTVAFSYDYSYTSSTTESQSYTVNVPAGESGYVTFTPTVSCVTGTFSGSCDWDVGTSGSACIPLYLSGTSGAVQGNWGFLQET